jgi:hypothetical protein
MVLTLELPIPKNTKTYDPLGTYASLFGGLPDWFDDISAAEARYLARKSLLNGVPLSAADHLIF